MKLFALIKKEFHRFFHDRRLIITMLLPGIIIFLLYTVLGEAIHTEPTKYDYKVYVDGGSSLTSVIQSAVEKSGNTVEWIPLEDMEAARKEVEEGEATAILSFTEDFDRFGENGADPADFAVSIVYDPMDEAGSGFYSLSLAVLQNVGMKFSVHSEPLASEESIGREVMQQILPFIIVCFVFSACMSVTLESVAGEKERGTLATILVTSAKRSHIALGKVVPLACISMLGALSSFLGVVLSMPKLMGLSVGMLGGYSFGAYVLIFLLILSFVPLIVSLISTISTASRSVKEASAYTSVLMIFVMIFSLVAAFVPAIGDWVVAIPILNAVVSMQGLLAGALPVWQSLVSVGANLVYTAGLVFLMTRMLSSEKVMFGK